MNLAIDQKIFRDYDIRGIYPEQINEKVFYILGRAIASYLKVKQVAVGYDCRISSPALSQALIRGLIDQGVNVIHLNLISTEILYFAAGNRRYEANIIISASHNPAAYNGLKIALKDVIPLHGQFGLPQIKELAVGQKFPTVSPGSEKSVTIIDDWISHVLTFISPKDLSPLKVVVDAGNGVGGISWTPLMNKLSVKIIPLYFEPDGNFPHHLPDPLHPENLIDIKDAIKINQADIGFALDGDADRLFVIDEKGNSLSGTVISALLAQILLQKRGPGTVLYNAVCGRIVPETIKYLKGQPERVRVGHSFIKEQMKKQQALFAGEHSGHFYFRENYYADSSTIAALLILEFLSSAGMPFSAAVKHFNKYAASGEINFKIPNVAMAMQTIKMEFSDADSTDELDGLSVWYKKWWFNIRASKTEPLLRLNIEAENSDQVDLYLAKIEKIINNLGGNRT